MKKTCLGCKHAKSCIMYEPRMKACKDNIDNAPTSDFDYLIQNAPVVIQYDGDTGKIMTAEQNRKGGNK